MSPHLAHLPKRGYRPVGSRKLIPGKDMEYNETLASKQEQIRALKQRIIQRKVAFWSLPAPQRSRLQKLLAKRRQQGKHPGRRPGKEIKLVDIDGSVVPPSQESFAERILKIIAKNARLFDDCDKVRVDDVNYAITENGYTLVPLTNGIHLQETSSQAFNVSWVRDASTLNLEAVSPQPQPRKPQRCRYFGRYGYCQRGKACHYTHDIATIRLCPRILALGLCDTKNCLLNHNPNNCNTELCIRKLDHGICLDPDCNRLHHKPPLYDDPKYEVWVCRPFAMGGYCQRGTKCPFVHRSICPDYEELGHCSKPRCPLKHINTNRHQFMMVSSDGTEEYGVFVQADQKLFPVNSYTTKWENFFVEGDTFDVVIDEDTNSLELDMT